MAVSGPWPGKGMCECGSEKGTGGEIHFCSPVRVCVCVCLCTCLCECGSEKDTGAEIQRFTPVFQECVSAALMQHTSAVPSFNARQGDLHMKYL